MFIKLLLFAFIAGAVSSRHVPRYADLDEDDQLLFRAAYDTPSYDHEEYQEDEELPMNKLDLLKDGMWAVKAKIKEMKTFNKAMAANLLATKLQLKQFLANHMKSIKKHHHVEIEKKKPVYSYQTPSPQPPAYGQYEHPHYTAPVYQYEASYYSAPVPQYEPPHQTAPVPQYGPSHQTAPAPQYEPSHYTAPGSQYELPHQTAPAPQYGPSQYGQSQFGAPQYGHDPYYGH